MKITYIQVNFNKSTLKKKRIKENEQKEFYTKGLMLFFCSVLVIFSYVITVSLLVYFFCQTYKKSVERKRHKFENSQLT